MASPAIAADVAAPAPVTTDFSYTGGRMATIRSPLANDAVRAVAFTGVTDDDDSKTVISYSGAKVASVSLPVPNSGATVEADRTIHHYATATARPR